MIRIIRLDERVRPVIAYHGTSDIFLREILKKGMLPNPSKRTWQDDSAVSSTQQSRVSLEGSYWTKNLHTAGSSAGGTVRKFGGSKLYVIASLIPESGVVDEDDIVFKFTRAVNRAMTKYHRRNIEDTIGLITVLLTKESSFEKIVEDVSELLHNQWAVNPSLKPIPFSLFERAVRTLLQRQFLYIKEEHTDFDWGDKLSRYSNSEYPPKYQNPQEINFVEKFGTKEELDRELLSSYNALTYYYKELAQDARDNAHGNNFRILEPVTYSGRNRIVAIAREIDVTTYEVVYGEVPEEAKQDFYRAIGASITWE